MEHPRASDVGQPSPWGQGATIVPRLSPVRLSRKRRLWALWIALVLICLVAAASHSGAGHAGEDITSQFPVDLKAPRPEALGISDSLQIIAASVLHDKLNKDQTAEAPEHKGTARVVAFADLHGDYEQALAVLSLAHLIDSDGHWCGGDSVLVQTGDVVDRGPDSIATIALMERLKMEARRAGGSVILLLGNHELMNLQGDFRYISVKELRRLGADSMPGMPKPEGSLGALRAAGLERWQRMLLPVSPLGAALRSRRTAVVVGQGRCRSLFVHAGVLPGVLARQSLNRKAVGVELLGAMNKAMWDTLEHCNSKSCGSTESGPESQLLGDEGPVWHRGYALQPEYVICERLLGVLQTVKAERMLVGHTVQQDGRIRARCGGRLLLLDVGMSHAYEGELAAWECTQGNGPVALYAGLTQPVNETFGT